MITYNHMVLGLIDHPGLDEGEIDQLFHALADSTRRDILTKAMHGDRSVSAIARDYSISLPAVQKHVGVLERAGLVTKHRQGREQIVISNVDSIHEARRVLDQLEQTWRERIDRISGLLAESGPPPDRARPDNLKTDNPPPDNPPLDNPQGEQR